MHTHLHPERLDLAVRIMERNGIRRMVDISAYYGESLVRLTEAAARYPGRFAFFAGVSPQGFGIPEWLARATDQVRRAAELGAVGIKFMKDWGLVHRDAEGQAIPVDDERLAPLFDLAGDLGLVVAFHTADPKAFFKPLTPDNERWEELSLNPDWWFGDRSRYPYDWWQLIRQLERVIRRHPQTTFLGVHFGCAAEEIENVADVMREHPNYIVDVAARLGEIGRHDAGTVRAVFLEFQDRILFGSDLGLRREIMLGAPQGFSPTEDDVAAFYDAHWRFFETDARQIDHPTPIQGRWKIDAIDLPDDVLRKIYCENARRWLRID